MQGEAFRSVSMYACMMIYVDWSWCMLIWHTVRTLWPWRPRAKVLKLATPSETYHFLILLFIKSFIPALRQTLPICWSGAALLTSIRAKFVFMSTYIDLCWSMLIYVDLCWFVMIYVDLLRYMLIWCTVLTLRPWHPQGSICWFMSIYIYIYIYI